MTKQEKINLEAGKFVGGEAGKKIANAKTEVESKRAIEDVLVQEDGLITINGVDALAAISGMVQKYSWTRIKKQIENGFKKYTQFYEGSAPTGKAEIFNKNLRAGQAFSSTVTIADFNPGNSSVLTITLTDDQKRKFSVEITLDEIKRGFTSSSELMKFVGRIESDLVDSVLYEVEMYLKEQLDTLTFHGATASGAKKQKSNIFTVAFAGETDPVKQGQMLVAQLINSTTLAKLNSVDFNEEFVDGEVVPALTGGVKNPANTRVISSLDPTKATIRINSSLAGTLGITMASLYSPEKVGINFANVEFDALPADVAYEVVSNQRYRWIDNVDATGSMPLPTALKTVYVKHYWYGGLENKSHSAFQVKFTV